MVSMVSNFLFLTIIFILSFNIIGSYVQWSLLSLPTNFTYVTNQSYVSRIRLNTVY